VARYKFPPMLDIRLLREQPDFVKTRLGLRGSSLDATVDEVLACDSGRRTAETRLQTLQADRNKLSKEIGRLRSQKQDSLAIEAQVKSQAAEMQTLAEESAAFEAKQRDLLLTLPNLPQATVPEGHDAEDNPVVRVWGEKPAIENPQDHLAIAARLKLLDFDRAAKISGSAFVCYTGQGARLERALVNFLLDLHTREHGYTEVQPPFVVKPESLIGTAQLPKFADQQYRCADDDLYLVPTAEVPVTNLHREEILGLTGLPVKYAAYTPCFRREAGSAGLGTRGLIRMHQFDKVELVKICTPETSNAELELLTADAEKVLQLLGLHYRVIELCTGDIGFGSARTYDIEVWSPGQQAYLEVSSCSNFEDFQARRMNLRFKGEDGKNRFCHTLNGSGTALARLYVALLETGLQPDGTVALPPPLHDYFGATKIS
jgi:seryl-tRNA synthetase